MYIAIDIGGTAIKYGLVDENGVLTERNEIATEAQLGGASIRDKVLGIVEHYVAQVEIKGVGISSAGMVDCETGRIIFANPLIPAYTGINHKEAVEARFHIPCEVENDVNCAGLAEGVAGAAKGTHSAVVMTVGTGIGGCLIADGRVYHGFSH
ncbi:MAG: ROK family protein, partial [Selenomonadaceae bacterium]|nr:ROK family protein [Selenomonadaceae bacterium]